jgi:hypothetical protein
MTAITPAIVTNLSKHFRRKERKGPKVVCKYCHGEIDPTPAKGINERRKKHLVECEKHDYDDTCITAALRDCAALQTFPFYDGGTGSSKIIQTLIVRM